MTKKKEEEAQGANQSQAKPEGVAAEPQALAAEEQTESKPEPDESKPKTLEQALEEIDALKAVNKQLLEKLNASAGKIRNQQEQHQDDQRRIAGLEQQIETLKGKG